MRELEKEYVLGDDVYVIHRFSAMTGMGVMKFVMQKCLPLLGAFSDFSSEENKEDGKKTRKSKNADAEKAPISDKEFIKVISDGLASIEEQELTNLMTHCLNHVEKKLRSGNTKVMNGKRFEIADLEYDMVGCLDLCVQCLAFNFSDFFGENSLGSFLGIKSSSQPKQ